MKSFIVDLLIASCSEGVGDGRLAISWPVALLSVGMFNVKDEDMVSRPADEGRKRMREGAEAAEDRVWKCHPFRILFRSSEASLDVGEMEIC